MRSERAPRSAGSGSKRACVLLALCALVACATGPSRFPLRAPRWEDADRRHVAEPPDERYSGLIADLVDKSLFRPLARLPYVPIGRRAQNVNALDEVPNSSWFHNRIGQHPLSPAQVAEAACAGLPPLDPHGTWTIVKAKPDGANPGFFIEAPSGRYLLKFDGEVQPLRATSADVIGSKFYWAAGYHAPCNQIVDFRREILRLSQDATAEDSLGHKHPLTQADVDKVLAAAFRHKDGSLRASASRFLPGRPLGPFRYEGTRGDDPNDHVPHEHRRELRGSKLLAAWLNHHDAREQNTLDVWIEQEHESHVRHYMLDFGDCLGGRWEFDALTRRTGHAYVLDWEQLPVDYLTLGLWSRPWYRARHNPEVEIFGYFTAQDFVASRWKTDYPNSAMIEARFDDELWMARILSHFGDDHVRAIVETARLPNPRHADYLVRTLIARRDRILREYFTRYAPLHGFLLVRRTAGDPTQSLCFEDLAIRHGFVDPRVNTYKVKVYGGADLDEPLGWLQFQPDLAHPGRACIQLPLGDRRPSDLAQSDAPDDDPLRYGVIKIWIHQRSGVRPTSAIHLHVYDLGPERGFRLVGIEHPDRPRPPPVY